MKYDFTKLINKIDAEVEQEYVGSAINWTDENFNDAWSKAIYEFENAIINGDPDSVYLAGEIYKKRCINYIRRYKEFKNRKSTFDFFKQLERKQKTG